MSEQLIEELKVLRIAKGETLVVQFERFLTTEQREMMMDTLERAGVKAIVLDGVATVAAVQAA